MREAWASAASGATLVDGVLHPGQELVVTSEMNEGGTVFGDGIEADRLYFPYGQTVTLARAQQAMRLA